MQSVKAAAPLHHSFDVPTGESTCRQNLRWFHFVLYAGKREPISFPARRLKQ